MPTPQRIVLPCGKAITILKPPKLSMDTVRIVHEAMKG